MTSFYKAPAKLQGQPDQPTQETELSALHDLPTPYPQEKPTNPLSHKKSQSSSSIYAKGRINSHRHSISSNKLNITQDNGGNNSNLSTYRNSVAGNEGDSTYRKSSISGMPLSSRTHHAHKKSMAGLSTRPASGSTTQRSPPKTNIIQKSAPKTAAVRPSSVNPPANRSPVKWSDKAQTRILQEKNTHKESIRRGMEGLDTVLHRKTLEKQVDMLEVRLNKLRFEEENMAKKIRETTEKTEKIMESKKRHQDDLILTLSYDNFLIFTIFTDLCSKWQHFLLQNLQLSGLEIVGIF